MFVPLPTSQIAESMESNLLSKSTNAEGFCKHFRNFADQSEDACRVKWLCVLFCFGLKCLIPIYSKDSLIPSCINMKEYEKLQSCAVGKKYLQGPHDQHMFLLPGRW